MAGEIVHLELPSRNFERSAAFYGKLFGWRAGPAQSGGRAARGARAGSRRGDLDRDCAATGGQSDGERTPRPREGKIRGFSEEVRCARTWRSWQGTAQDRRRSQTLRCPGTYAK